MKLISLCPSNTELIHFLGLSHLLIGIDDFSDWPKQIQHLPKLGPDLSIDMDKVEALEPDLVLASLSVPGMEKNVEALRERNIPHVVYNPQSLTDIQHDLLDLGKRTSHVKEAEKAVSWMKQEINKYGDLREKVSEKKKVYFEWWPKPVFTPGKTNWLTEISTLAGCENLFQDVELASVQTTWEDVVSRRPEVIAMVWVGVKTEKMNIKHVKSRAGWEELEALGTRIVKLEENLFCRPSPRLIFGMKRLASLVHPHTYPEFSYDEEKKIKKTRRLTSL